MENHLCGIFVGGILGAGAGFAPRASWVVKKGEGVETLLIFYFHLFSFSLRCVLLRFAFFIFIFAF